MYGVQRQWLFGLLYRRAGIGLELQKTVAAGVQVMIPCQAVVGPTLHLIATLPGTWLGIKVCIGH